MLQFIYGLFSRQKVNANVEMDEKRWIPALKWCPTSISALEEAEQKLLSFLRTPNVREYVSIPALNDGKNDYKIRSLKMNENEEDRTPLVLLHGFASGIGLWVLNLDSFAENRPVYALDLLGFGLSSRPHFSSDSNEVEQQFVESIEQWRQRIGLEKFILLGHSMGGFLAAAYSLKYPERISHLILADPWGFTSYDDRPINIQRPLWIKIIAGIMSYFNPLSGLRAAGPWGPRLVVKFRPDILQKFIPVVDEPEIVSSYIYHCNAQVPSGEMAFKSLSMKYGWAKSPMVHRIGQLKEDIPITFIYGARSWMESETGERVKEIRTNSVVEVKKIKGAGHHVYADNIDAFNLIVNTACFKTDEMTQKKSLEKKKKVKDEKQTFAPLSTLDADNILELIA